MDNDKSELKKVESVTLKPPPTAMHHITKSKCLYLLQVQKRWNNMEQQQSTKMTTFIGIFTLIFINELIISKVKNCSAACC